MITLQNIYKSFLTRKKETFAVLSNVNLHIPQGSFTCIVGASGAGKSTLLRLLNGLEKPDSGTIDINSVSLTDLKTHELREFRRKVGFIFQQFHLVSNLTVFGNVALPLQIAGRKKADIQKRAEECLKQVGLLSKKEEYPAQLSGGQKQRVGIARALTTSPEVLLADEPTSSLDPHTKHEIFALLKDINQKQKITIVLITHEPEIAQKYADTLVWIHEGQIQKDLRHA